MKLKTTLLLVLLCLLAGCVNEYESGCPVEPTTGCTYEIRFVFSSMGNMTRSLPEDKLEDGRRLENYVDISKTHFLLFTNTVTDRTSPDYGNETLLAALKPSILYPVDDSAYPVMWEVRAAISDQDGVPLTVEQMEAGFRIVCIANVENWVEPTVGTKLKEFLKTLLYTRPSFTYEDDINMCIPMYGVMSVAQGRNFQPDWVNSIGEMGLLRAMAKIELTISESNAQVQALEFANASLINYYTEGRVAPDGIYKDTKAEEVELGSKLEYRSVFLPPSPTLETTALPFYITSDSKGKANRRAVLYVPEFDNASPLRTDADHMKISVKFKGRVTSEFDICEYDAGVPKLDGNGKKNYLNVPRNYWLNFKLSTDGKYAYVVQVGMQKWSEINGEHDVYNW